MANNRIGLRCRSCGEVFQLGKTFSSGYRTAGWSLEGGLNQFYTDHHYCRRPLNVDESVEPEFVPSTGYFHTENQFELVYEFLRKDLQTNFD